MIRKQIYLFYFIEVGRQSNRLYYENKFSLKNTHSQNEITLFIIVKAKYILGYISFIRIWYIYPNKTEIVAKN